MRPHAVALASVAMAVPALVVAQEPAPAPAPKPPGPTGPTGAPAGTAGAPQNAAPAAPDAAGQGPAPGPVPGAVPNGPNGNAVPNGGPGDFTVGNIRVEGLQRVSEGTVYNYLPVNIGDHLTPTRVREAIRALYATGFFRDVQLRREGNTLIVVLLERPSIESFEISGNKDIKTEELQKSLRNVGLAAGKTFDRSVLEDVTQYLTEQYFNRGKYGVRVDTKVEDQSGNRVKVKIEIKEGQRAVIRQINLVGATKFPQKEILQEFELKTPNWLSWYKQDDRYSRDSLQGDLEKLRNFYMDRGHANFEVDSTQVTIAPEKQDMFITVNISEGEVFKIKDVKLAGTFVVPRAELEQLIIPQPGQIFNRKLITATQELIQNRLGRDGYAFAKVEPVPTPDNTNHTVSLTYFIDPGNRVYVRNITFSGSKRINDEVLRREMRQLEGGWLSNTSLERSKQRIQKLPYVKNVDFETTPVTGTPDLVDVNYKIEEGPASTIGGGIGYSEAYKFTLNGNFVDSNFLGSGQRVAVNLEGGAFSKVYSISQTNPYTSIDGLQRTISATYRDVTQFVSNSSNFSSQTFSFGPTWAYPVSEFQYVRLGAVFNDAKLLVSTSGSAIQAQQWVMQNGHPYSRLAHDDGSNNEYVFYGTNFTSGELVAGWDLDTRNRSLFADRGMRVSASISSTIPVSSVQYYIAHLQFQRYVPLFSGFYLSFLEGADFGNPLGKTTAIPPFLQMYGGGPDNVRGFRESFLGPKDQFGNPYGGNLRITSQNELVFPLPQKFRQSARVGVFFDMGGVYQTGHNYQFFAPDGITPVNYGLNSFNDIRRSVGVAVEWLAPLGLFRFSFGVPLNSQHFDPTRSWGDSTEGFQFSIGQAF